MQLTLELQPGLTEQYRSLREVIASTVYQHRSGIGGVATALDMSPSELGRRLNHSKDDPQRNLDVDDLVRIVEATGDLSPIYWLAEKFVPNDEQKHTAAVEQLQRMLPQLAHLLAVAGHSPAKGGRR